MWILFHLLNPGLRGNKPRKIPIILKLYLFKTLNLLAGLYYSRGRLFSEGLIIGGSLALQNGLGLSMGLYSGGLVIGRIFASEIWGAYFREGLLLLLFFFFLGGGLIIGILRYLVIIYENSSLSSGIVRVSEVLN